MEGSANPKNLVSTKTKKVIKEGEDHEVSMAGNQLDTIIKAATELKAKIGTDEKNLPGWVQDHISQSENFISQANNGYGETNEVIKKGKFNEVSNGDFITLDVNVGDTVKFYTNTPVQNVGTTGKAQTGKVVKVDSTTFTVKGNDGKEHKLPKKWYKHATYLPSILKKG